MLHVCRSKFINQFCFNFIVFFLFEGTCVSERIPGVAYPDGHNVLHSDSKENSVLHSEFDTAHGPHIFPVCASVLLASRSWWKGHAGHQHFTVTSRLPIARLQNTATHFFSTAAHRQILAIHVHHEHRQYIGHCYHYQLEFSRSVLQFMCTYGVTLYQSYTNISATLRGWERAIVMDIIFANCTYII